MVRPDARGFHANAPAAEDELSRLLGLPKCCVQAARGACNERSFAWEAWARRNECEAQAPLDSFPLWIPAIGFVPCTAGCEAAACTYATWFDAIGLPSPLSRSHAVLCSLDEHADGDAVVLDVRPVEADSVAFDPASVRGTDAELVAVLQRCNAFRLQPGQILVQHEGKSLAALTATHALWSATRTWHADTWQELARAAMLLADRGEDRATYVPPFESCRSGRSSDEGLVGPARAPASYTQPEAARANQLAAVVRHVLSHVPSLTHRATLIDLEPSGVDGTLRLRLTIDGTAYELLLSPADAQRPCLFATPHFNVSYPKQTPMTSSAHQRIARIVVLAMERVAWKQAPDLLRSKHE
jgi:hypothetical protein